MTRDQLSALLHSVQSGKLSPATALDSLACFPSESLGFATIDHHRELRQGRPEVIYSESKTVAQVVAIAERLNAAGGGFLATRVSGEQLAALQQRFDGLISDDAGRTVWLPAAEHHAAVEDAPVVLIVAAGTSDLPVADEAAITLTAFSRRVERLNDVGVAGIHRLLVAESALRRAAVVIAVAGMEGALASVVGGLVRAPVIAVPTSVGYGASFGGVAALLAMLNSCAAGVTVTNIDNGFGAAVAADRLLSVIDALVPKQL